MSIRTVNREIRSALQDKVVTEAEAKAIVAETVKGRVTTGESKAVAEVWNQANKWETSGPMGHISPPRVQMDAGATKTFNDFFLKNMVPSGDAHVSVKAQIEDHLKGINVGAPLDCAPDTKHLHPVFLKDKRPLDGVRDDAWLDTEKNSFYLQTTGAGMAGPDTVGPFWFGPFQLPADPVKASASDVRALLEGDYTKTYDLGRELFGNTISRSSSVTIEDVSERKDGLFDVNVGMRHWRSRDMQNEGNLVVDAAGRVQTGAVPTVKAAVVDKMRAAFEGARDSLSFRPDGMPLGRRFHRVELERQPGFDTYTFTALIPVGGLFPLGQKVSDPNKADEIFIERSGGLIGSSMFAGPVKLNAVPAASDTDG